jgi:low affinity Fe/Cu permease
MVSQSERKGCNIRSSEDTIGKKARLVVFLISRVLSRQLKQIKYLTLANRMSIKLTVSCLVLFLIVFNREILFGC